MNIIQKISQLKLDSEGDLIYFREIPGISPLDKRKLRAYLSQIPQKEDRQNKKLYSKIPAIVNHIDARMTQTIRIVMDIDEAPRKCVEFYRIISGLNRMYRNKGFLISATDIARHALCKTEHSDCDTVMDWAWYAFNTIPNTRTIKKNIQQD